ncbi:hypothetical protein OIU78_025756 [Salix suchowensis]|nr:hypothetical protein OIU78_025756 [Salix suchowensis]
MPRQKDGLEPDKAPASERSMKTRAILARQVNGIMPDQGVRPVAEVPPAGSANVSSWGISSIFGGGDHSGVSAKENSTSKSYNEPAQSMESFDQSMIHLREPPTILRPFRKPFRE